MNWNRSKEHLTVGKSKLGSAGDVTLSSRTIRVRKLGVLLCCVGALTVTTAFAYESRHFSFETPSDVETCSGHRVYFDNENCDGELIDEEGRSYHLAIKGDPAKKRLWRSSTYFRGTRSMAYEISPTEMNEVDYGDGHVSSDKLFHGAARQGESSERLHFGFKRYVSFAFNFPQNFQAPSGELLILQAHQASCSSPGFAINVKMLEPGEGEPKDVTLQFVVRNDSTGNNWDDLTVIGERKVAKDKWHRIAVMLIPRHENFENGQGEIKVWVDHDSDPAHEADFGNSNYILQEFESFGYDPNGKHCDVDSEGNDGTLKLNWGLYRHRQNKFHKILFDEVRVGTGLSSVRQ